MKLAEDHRVGQQRLHGIDFLGSRGWLQRVQVVHENDDSFSIKDCREV
jgi:hypothetical protein